jgi:hypothetical protein
MAPNLVAVCTALIAYAVTFTALARANDPLTNPDAVKHHIDRSAMEIQIQGWTRDLRFPVYPIRVQAASTGVYYTTWAAAGFVDTDLSFLSFLELYRTDVAERRVTTRRVVEPLDVIEHISAGLFPGPVHLSSRALSLQ